MGKIDMFFTCFTWCSKTLLTIGRMFRLLGYSDLGAETILAVSTLLGEGTCNEGQIEKYGDTGRCNEGQIEKYGDAGSYAIGSEVERFGDSIHTRGL